MHSSSESAMLRNIRLFGIYKVFTKRVFLPLTTIYASQVAGLSIAEIGLTTALGSAVSILFETTSGFWADKHGRRNSARVGAFLAVIATLCYIFSPNFPGILAASITLSIGYSFMSGSVEALMHDSLLVLGRPDDYAKLASRAQSLSLVINAGIVAAVPLLYPIDHRLPFVAGALAYLILFLLASLLTEPSITHDVAREELKFFRSLRRVLVPSTIPFFVIAGLAFAMATSPVDLYNLSLVNIGLTPAYIGTVYAAASLVGAGIGVFVHTLKRLSFRQYATFDLFMNGALMASIGLVHSLPVVIVAFVLNMAFWRYENIMYQHYLLKIYGGVRYKAMMLSVLSNFRLIHEVWLTIVFTGFAQRLGLIAGVTQGIWMTLLLWPLLMISIGLFQKSTTKIG